MQPISKELQKRLREVHLLAFDVDGVMTGGGVYILEDGQQFRRFDVKDGLGLKRVIDLGVHVALISLSNVGSIRYRAKALGIKNVQLGVIDKLAALEEICESININLQEVAYMGDDLTDLPVLHQVGFPCAPADAVELVKQTTIYTSHKKGGHGAVREVCDILSDLLVN